MLLRRVVCVVTMSSGGKMTSCVGSKGAKSAVLNRVVASCVETDT